MESPITLLLVKALSLGLQTNALVRLESYVGGELSALDVSLLTFPQECTVSPAQITF